jgi:hypothetical protein
MVKESGSAEQRGERERFLKGCQYLDRASWDVEGYRVKPGFLLYRLFRL